MIVYRGFSIQEYLDEGPWGTKETALFKKIVDTVLDHKHNALVKAGTTETALYVEADGRIVFGPLVDGKTISMVITESGQYFYRWVGGVWESAYSITWGEE